MSDDKIEVDPNVIAETPLTDDEVAAQTEAQEASINTAIVTVLTPLEEKVFLGQVSLLENGTFIRQNLTEYYETCSYTHYNIEYGVGAAAVAINDFVELMNYITPTEGSEEEIKFPIDVTLRMTLADYDEKASMSHVKRFRELIMFPPQTKAVLPEKENKEETGPEEDIAKSNASVAAAKEKAKSNLPKPSSFTTEVSLQNFYDNVLYSVGLESEGSRTVILSDSIMNVSYSGWNPPPLSRSTAGDLCYFEVRTASNSVIHITACAGGFFVNNSTLNHFDPSPAEKAHFSHELLFTIAGANPPFSLQWESLGSKLEAAEQSLTVANSPANALQSIAALYQQGRGDFTFQTPQWHAQASCPGGKGHRRAVDTKHKYDSSRAQTVLADSFGMEEKGVPREWNEEIQSIRALPAKDTSEQIMKSRFAFRTTSEFSDVCRQTVIAICKGHIAPVNPMDPADIQVYIYNNIFFSRAIDTKEAFKVCSGNEACRKSAAQDFKNQKLLHSLGIEGLSSVLCTVVDFLGQRVVCQSIIPGILQQANESVARLMYGALEEGVRLKCKTEAFTTMQEIGQKLNIAERNILAVPNLHLNEDRPAPAEAQPESMMGFLSGPEGSQSPSIKLDDLDEMFPPEAKVISHVGPLEGKLLKGSDNRLYVLEVNRLTPRDANFVQKDKGGTGLVEKLAAEEDDVNVHMTYCLRQELLQEYISTETMALRQAELQTLLAKLRLDEDANEEQERALEDGKEKEVKEGQEDSSTVVATGEEKQEVKEKTEEEKAEEARKNALTEEELQRISKIETTFTFNPNCFLGEHMLCSDNADDAATLEKDEQLARDLASFLWTKSLPNMNTMIRVGNYVAQDGTSLTALLHARGINMRYLGQLAVLADEAEEADKKLIKEGKVMKNPMPHYWLDLLVVEVLARSMKHLLNQLLVSNKAVRTAPGRAIAAFLNYLLATPSAAAALLSAEVSDSKKESSGGKKKGKKGSDKARGGPHTTSSLTVPEAYKVPLTKNEFWAQLKKIATSKFLFTGVLTDKQTLSPRISRVALLRRLCQTCGLRVLCKDFDFSSAQPFAAADIQELYPLVKSSEPLVVFAGGQSLLQAAMGQLQNDNHGVAYDLAQEASKWMGQVTGPVHATTCQAIEIMSSVLMQFGDNEAAISTFSKKLTLDVQLHGLDSNEVMQGHTFLGTIYHEVNNFEAAVAHLQSALYILRLMAGNSHPEIANIYFRLAVVYNDVGDHAAALQLLQDARALVSATGDLAKNVPIYQTLATVHAIMSNFKDALVAQKMCWNLSRQLFGDEDQRTEQSKQRLATLIRENAEFNAKQVQDKADRDRSEKVNRSASSSLWLEDDMTVKKKKSAKKKPKKKSAAAETSATD